jgi:hypothetical protein
VLGLGPPLLLLLLGVVGVGVVVALVVIVADPSEASESLTSDQAVHGVL